MTGCKFLFSRASSLFGNRNGRHLFSFENIRERTYKDLLFSGGQSACIQEAAFEIG
jgi:hypothetical protein